MTLSDLAAFGSFVSGLAVLLSLIFLLLQIRQTNRNQRALMQQGISARYFQMMTANSSPEVAKTVARVAQGEGPLEPWEIMVAVNALGVLFANYEDSFLQHRAGTLDAVSWATEVTSMRGNVRWPPNRAAWRLTRDTYGPDFRAFVDDVLESTKGEIFEGDPVEEWNVAMAADRPASIPKMEGKP